MLWFTQKVLRQVPGKWTFVMVTDRTELDTQLHDEFADAGAIPAEARVHAESIAHLRELLTADHRYVFTLIQKFQPSKGQGEREMPVLSERSDIIVITDEAHRSQYDTLALNMRRALPNASMMGFTGTPLIAGEEQATREQFGEYVSIYNFRDAIEDGATVPLYYENRIPELQLTNADFAEELDALLEEAELDEDAEGALAREFGTQYTLLTRPERFKTIAKDLVAHFVGRGFSGKAMYVGLDKAAAVRMYNLVQEAWAEHLADLRRQHDALPELERPWLASRIELMETTDMAVVVSQGQNELRMLDELGLDIRPHRERMNREDLAEKFKDAADPLRLVFVCAMWMTGFDAPSVSTIYLDRPMKNHTLMQTIARANRVFPDKDNGLIVDYVGVFRNLEKALAIYGAASAGESPIEIIDALSAELDGAVAEILSFCSGLGVDLLAMRDAQGFDHIAKRDAAVEALLVDEETRADFTVKARQARKLFKALLPNPKAAAQQRTVAAIRVLHERIIEVTRPPAADISGVADAVDALLDRSVGAEEYVIRAAAQGRNPDPLIDLSLIDFDGLAQQFAGRKRAETDRLAQLLRQQAISSAQRNPTRHELVERIEQLIADYNAGSVNIDEYLHRLIELSKTLTEEEERAVREGMTEEELAIFDLLTQPDPILTPDEETLVKTSARRLLDHLHEKLVQDWRRKVSATNDVNSTIRRVLDEGLPESPYTTDIFTKKVQLVFDHILSAYGDNGETAYDFRPDVAFPPEVPADISGPVDVNKIADDVVARIRVDPDFAAQVAHQLRT
jgi:type I restriction enzyme, R subunit